MTEAETDDDAPNPNSPTAKLITELVAKGLSQGEIARRTSIPQSRLSRWSQGQNTKVPDDALKLVELNRRTRAPARRRKGAAAP